METKTIQANNLEFAYYEQGQGDKLVVLLHGFPETADTWLELLPKLADAGYRAIAPFMRGIPPTQYPADEQYSIRHLAEDTIGLIDALGADSSILIGHAWGASTAYMVSALAPERVTKLITVDFPHPRAIKRDLKSLWKLRHMFMFQIRDFAVNWMKRDNYAMINTFYKRWSPNWRFTEADVEAVRKSMSQPGGVEAALGYYWSGFENSKKLQSLAERITETPTLSILGENGLMASERSRNEEAHIGPYRHVILPNTGHFLHREEPEKFANLVIEFLNG